MQIKYPLAKPFIDDSDKQNVMSVLDSGILALGPYMKKFEDNIASYTNSSYACAVSSGTSGLHLAIRALGITTGDEVITSPFSFIASSNCILYEEATPIFVDIKEDTFNLDPYKIEQAITTRTKAILVVHIFGQSADMEHIMHIAKKHNLFIIEDACESLGSTYNENMTGTMGNIGVYAFYPNKQMTTGEGGIIVTESKKLYESCMSMRNQGRALTNDWLLHERLGYNYRMDEMSAALGCSQLSKLEWMIGQKDTIAQLYTKYFQNNSHVVTPQIAPYGKHSWFVYVIRVPEQIRDKLIDKLLQKGIQTKPYLPAIHMQPFMKKQFQYKKGVLPQVEAISDQTIALPFYIGLREKDIVLITNIINTLIKTHV